MLEQDTLDVARDELAQARNLLMTAREDLQAALIAQGADLEAVRVLVGRIQRVEVEAGRVEREMAGHISVVLERA